MLVNLNLHIHIIYRDKFPQPRLYLKLSIKLTQNNKVSKLKTIYFLFSNQVFILKLRQNRTDLLGIPPYWVKTSINPLFLWESWIGQCFLAAGLEDNINLHDLLVEPTEVIDKPPSRPESVAEDEDAGAANARRQRDQAAIRRITELNVERRRKGPRINQNWFYHEAEARMKSRLFFALGNEGRRRFADSFPHTDIGNIPFREFHIGCETLFKVEREFTVERIKLYNTVFMLQNDTFSSFYAHLSAQVALCNWPNDQEK